PAAASADEPRMRVDFGGTFSRFEQQVKAEVGGARGERLVESAELGLLQMLSYRVWGPFSAGYFVQLDTGTRRAGRFVGFDAEGKTVVGGELGGAYHELWAGPLVRAEWRRLFVELGWGAYGARVDEGRDDLPSEGGSAAGALRTTPNVAWVFAAGGGVPITRELELALRLEYRIRYYDRRGGEPLAGGVVHGTQNFTPFVGLAYRFGPR
ncbi:MAG TPA: hypothetical protein VLS89_09280, partial [Candidatus Nanopelagicales bacterium]|nr:hypothetical protein [Candidatus Nanopelagicales bacterium]